MPHLKRHELEKWFAGEIVDPKVNRHLDECDHCASLLFQLKKDQEELLARRPAKSFMAALQVPSGEIRTSRRRYQWAPVWAAAFSLILLAAGAVYLVSIKSTDTGESHPAESYQWKGNAPAVELYIKRDSETRRVSEVQIHPGDALMYKLTAPPHQKGYTALMAVENHEVSRVFPNQTDNAMQVNGTLTFPNAVQIDPGTREMRLILVYREEAFSVEKLKHEMEAALKSSDGLQHIFGVVDIRQVTAQNNNAEKSATP